ncbi:sensor histidine kinase [Streptomyces sp. NPDC050560]|uniref:sensor histidine kinase n=1 Tax=Streptomyces sp. NPDC050560 TaxID=3365630 RepID=UPI00378E5857
MRAEDMTPPHGFALLPWLVMELGPILEMVEGETPHPWLGWIGLVVFNALYTVTAFRAFDKPRRRLPSTRYCLVALGVIAFGLEIGYGHSWQLLFPLLALATGSVLRGRWLAWLIICMSVAAALISAWRSGWESAGIGYGTFISGMVTASLLALRETVIELRETREELARTAVESERLRFSRDLHDLLGHTLSVIVVKSEAARRIAHRDLGAALTQVTDIESVGRQALTEIREAVTGYREGSLATELDRARSALTAAGIEPVVRQSGPPLPARTEALLGWVVREAVTNAVRHSAASRCEIAVAGRAERVSLTVSDNGRGAAAERPAAQPVVGGTGLKGLTERLSAAGGSLAAGPGARGGFQVTAELPVEEALKEPGVR